MNKAFVNWIVEEEKMPCIYHSFMSPKGILKKPLLRQINLPLAKALFYKVSRGLKSIQAVFKDSKANICGAYIIYQWNLASSSSLHIFELGKIHLYISSKNINSIFAEGLECEIFCVWCHEGIKEEQGDLTGYTT